VERWPEEDAAYFLQRSNVMCSNRAEAFSYLSKGIVNLFLKCFRAVLCSCFEDSIVRDRHIGEMINMSEERICNRFPNLKEGVNLCVYIGGSHFPEQHTDIQVKIIDLVDSKDIVGKIMCAYGRREEKTVTDLDLVRSAFCSAFPRDSRVLSGQVGTMDIAEIVKEITALQKREKSGVSAFEQVKY